jgi:hypothetical protein
MQVRSRNMGRSEAGLAYVYTLRGSREWGIHVLTGIQGLVWEPE